MPITFDLITVLITGSYIIHNGTILPGAICVSNFFEMFLGKFRKKMMTNLATEDALLFSQVIVEGLRLILRKDDKPVKL